MAIILVYLGWNSPRSTITIKIILPVKNKFKPWWISPILVFSSINTTFYLLMHNFLKNSPLCNDFVLELFVARRTSSWFLTAWSNIVPVPLKEMKNSFVNTLAYKIKYFFNVSSGKRGWWNGVHVPAELRGTLVCAWRVSICSSYGTCSRSKL